MVSHHLRRAAILSAAACLLFIVSCAAGKNVRSEPAPEIVPTVSLASVPTHVLGKGMAEIQVLLDKSNGLSSAALSLLSGKAGWSVPEHRHADADEILYIFEGGGELTLSGEKFLLSAGSAVFIPQNALHSFICGSTGVKALQVYAPGGPEQRFLKAPLKNSQ